MQNRKKSPARVVPTKTNYYEIVFYPWEDEDGLHDTGPIYVFEENLVKAAINATYSQMRRYRNIGIKQITNMHTKEVFKGKLDWVPSK